MVLKTCLSLVTSILTEVRVERSWPHSWSFSNKKVGVTWIMPAIQSELSSGMNWVGPSLFPWLLLYSGRDPNSVTCRVFSAVPLDIPLFWSLWPQRTIVTTVLFLTWSWSRLSPGSSCLFSFKIYYLGPYLQALKNVISKGLPLIRLDYILSQSTGGLIKWKQIAWGREK